MSDLKIEWSSNVEHNTIYLKLKYMQQIYDWSDKTILIYETDPTSAYLLFEILDSTKARIIHIHKSTEMKNFYSKLAIDVIINGISIKEVNSGLKLTSQIKLKYPDVPMIAHSACVTTENIHAFYKAGCSAFVAKPFELDELLSLIAGYMDRGMQKQRIPGTCCNKAMECSQ